MVDQSGMRPKFDPGSAPEEAPDEHKSFNTIVGEGIRRARQAHGWTQAFLAMEARLSPNYVARLERGELGPSLFVASRICEALAIEVEALVGPRQAPSALARVKTAKRRAG